MTKKIIAVMLIVLLSAIGIAFFMAEDVDETKLSTEDKKFIVCTAFPVYDWLNEIIGENADKFNIRLLVQNGDVHSFQPTLSDILKIHLSDLFVYVGGVSEKWTDKVIKENEVTALKLFDCLENSEKRLADTGHHHDHAEHSDDEYDEHIWLSLRLAERMVNAICDGVAAVDPDGEALYRSNAKAYCEKLKNLDNEYKKAVAESEDKTIIFADRFPFLYLTEDYGAESIAAFPGCSTDTDASFETVVRLSEKVKALDKKTILVLENSDRTVANAVIGASGNQDIQIAVMNSCQSIAPESVQDAEAKKIQGKDLADGADYIAIMEENLKAFREALK